MSDQNTVEYGSDEYYEETGKNGLTINTKNTENLPAYDKKLFYLDSFFKRMVYSNNSRNLTTYSNFYYKDNDGKVYYWHRKRKGKYACMPGGSIIYIDAEASMERFTGEATIWTIVEPWKRAPVFHGMLDGKAYFTVIGSSKFDDPDESNLEVYLAKSKDGLLIEPVLNIHERWGWSTRQYECFRPNYMGKLGHYINEAWRKEDDPNPDYNMRHKIFCHNYNGLNYTVDLIAQDLYGDGDLEPMPYESNWMAKGEITATQQIYPIFMYRYTLNMTGSVDPTLNTHNFCDYYSSQYITRAAYYWYKYYNANTKQTYDLPFVTFMDSIYSFWRNKQGGYYTKVVDPKTFPILVLRSSCIRPVFDIVAICPNGNVLVSIYYRCDPRFPTYVSDEYPEYVYFSRFNLCPIFYVIDFTSGEWIKSNIQEPEGFDLYPSYQYSEPSIADKDHPVYIYTDGEYAWFRKPYREDTDITFYGTKDGYNIDKRITYYNRTSIPATYHMMTKSYSEDKEEIRNYNISKSYLQYSFNGGSAVVPVPVFENGVFQKYMAVIASDYTVNYESTGNNVYGLIDDLKPESDGRLHCHLVYQPADNQRYDRYRVRYTREQPGQTDDDYIFEIE